MCGECSDGQPSASNTWLTCSAATTGATGQGGSIDMTAGSGKGATGGAISMIGGSGTGTRRVSRVRGDSCPRAGGGPEDEHIEFHVFTTSPILLLYLGMPRWNAAMLGALVPM